MAGKKGDVMRGTLSMKKLAALTMLFVLLTLSLAHGQRSTLSQPVVFTHVTGVVAACSTRAEELGKRFEDAYFQSATEPATPKPRRHSAAEPPDAGDFQPREGSHPFCAT